LKSTTFDLPHLGSISGAAAPLVLAFLLLFYFIVLFQYFLFFQVIMLNLPIIMQTSILDRIDSAVSERGK
jgi:hypothetical protein